MCPRTISHEAAFIIAAAVITDLSMTFSDVGLNPLRKCFFSKPQQSNQGA